MELAFKFARNAYWIGRIMAGSSRKGRRTLFFSYMGLRLKARAERLHSKRNVYQAKLLGFKINCFSYSRLAFLIEEIFIDRAYHFKPVGNAPLIFDVGSNIGVSVLFFKWLYPTARIVAFEPDTGTFALLKKNVEENGLKDVRLYNMAAYDSEGMVPFYYDPEDAGHLRMSTRKERLPKASRNVQSIMLSSYIEDQVDFLKMDIEGAETKVIKELSACNKLCKVREMVIEYHHHVTPENDELSEILTVLEKSGFGYQITSFRLTGPFEREEFQDILLYAYRK